MGLCSLSWRLNLQRAGRTGWARSVHSDVGAMRGLPWAWDGKAAEVLLSLLLVEGQAPGQRRFGKNSVRKDVRHMQPL